MSALRINKSLMRKAIFGLIVLAAIVATVVVGDHVIKSRIIERESEIGRREAERLLQEQSDRNGGQDSGIRGLPEGPCGECLRRGDSPCAIECGI